MKALWEWGEGAAKDRKFTEPRLLMANVRWGTSGKLQNFLGRGVFVATSLAVFSLFLSAAPHFK